MIKKILIIFLGIVVLATCKPRDSYQNRVDNICGQDPCYEGPFDPPWVSGLSLSASWDDILTHDNRVLETDNFLVFSDASSDEAKIMLGNTAEAALELIKNLFVVSSEDLGIRDRGSKFKVYSARREDKSYPRAFTDGFVMWAYDSDTFPYQELIPDATEHECTHVVQYKLGGLFSRTWDWFTEGLAEHISDGGPYIVITCWPEVDEWRQDPGHVNPITIQELGQIPDYAQIGGQRREEYYPLFGLAVRYLVDPNGHAKTMIDVKNMFADIRGNQQKDFATVFEAHMGMSLEYYEENFYSLMEAYLPATCVEDKETEGLNPKSKVLEIPPAKLETDR
jgi:hypothetical protein